MSDNLEWIVSVDDHVIEPENVWQDRLPSSVLDRAPRIVRDGQGEAWLYEDKRIPTIGLAAAAGRKKEEFSPLPVTYDEMRPGCYDSKERIVDMDRDGVLASLCFPSFPRFCGQTFHEADDHDLALLCVRAYNDWMIDEWSGAAPGRFIPLIIVPLWDPAAAAVEIERCAVKGAKGIAFSENPFLLGLPSIHDRDHYWDPVFAAAADTGMPICTHIGSSSQLPKTSDDNPMIETITLTPMNSMMTCVDWLYSGVFQRHPDLKLCLSEGGIGWIPYVLERCDYAVERQGYWASKADFSGDLLSGVSAADETAPTIDLSVPPSEIFRRHIYGCFIDDPHGVESLDAIGVDNVMIETDYPHTDSTWPNSQKLAHERLAHRTEEERHKIFRGNAERVFDFIPAPVPGPS